MGNVPLIINQGDGDFDSFRRLALLVHCQPRNSTKEHRRKTGYGDGGGRDTSRPYLLQRKAYGSQRPLPPLSLEGELDTIIIKSQGKCQRRSFCVDIHGHQVLTEGWEIEESLIRYSSIKKSSMFFCFALSLHYLCSVTTGSLYRFIFH